MCGMLLPILGCGVSNKSILSEEITSSEVEPSVDHRKEIEAHLVDLSNEITLQIPAEISEDLLLPVVNEDGYEVDYEVNQSTIENGVLKYINGRNDITATLIITVYYGDLTYTTQVNIIFKGVMTNEGLMNYLEAYKAKLPSLV